MKNKLKHTIIAGISVIVSLMTASPLFAQDANFNPAYIISDQEILDSSGMTLVEIQALLQAKNSYLATYQVVDATGNTMSAAQAIYDRAVNNRVNPKFIIVLLQKEQGLIEDASPSQGRLDWATGYGCPDGGGCNDRWRGLWKQINSASLQFRDYMDNPHLYRFKAGQTYTFTNPYSTTFQGNLTITLANQATAALYNYTPHVYNGNYNFWKIWQRYFTRSYLNGSLLQVSGENGVWLIENGVKRAFLTRGALTSRYDISRVQVVSKADLDKYPLGEPIRFAQYSIVRIPTGQIYLLVDNTKRRFANMEAFRKLGFNPDEIIAAGQTDVDGYQEAEAITVASAYPTGALLQNKKTGGVYWLSAGVKAPIWDSMFLKTRFKNKKITPVASTELEKYPTVDPIRFKDGDLVKSNLSPSVYVIENGIKRPFDSGTTFTKLGYKWENILTFSQKVLDLHSDGPVVTTNL
jgi:hypothetical protein